MSGAPLALGLTAALTAGAWLHAQRGGRAMKGPRDLPADLVVSVQEAQDQIGCIFVDLGRKGAFWWDGPGGRIVLEKTRWNLWEIVSVEAEHGYGPLLYDLAMELAWLNGVEGILPDRSGVSDAAERVWIYYEGTRSDVTRKPIPADYPDRDKHTLRHRDFLDHVYAKSDAPLLRDLHAQGKLVDVAHTSLLRGLTAGPRAKARVAHGSRAMKTPADLGPSWKVKICKRGEDYRLELYPAQGGAVGGMTLGAHRGFWSVRGVSAEHGYGPLLYDLALECVGLLSGKGLHPDSHVSTEAGEVWRHYASARLDVRSEILPPELRLADRGDPRRAWLSRSFLKEGAPFLEQLQARHQLRVRLPEGDALRRALEGL